MFIHFNWCDYSHHHYYPENIVEIKFIRKGHIIKNIDGDVVFEGKCPGSKDGNIIPSINAAKRESRRLQATHGAFCVKVAA
jgi:hypothetical protein